MSPLYLRQVFENQSNRVSKTRFGSSMAPFVLPQNFISGQDKQDDMGMNTNFNEEETIAKPVLGLNLKDYFDKRHLVDQPPVEPLPPIENPLEMTQNHEDWVRGQEDFKINHEQIQQLQTNNSNAMDGF